ncbi:hypothetical protein [Humibacter albus]|uniref:hypothetical protein n=1 Tax=Humibacter albus TaxID=427754 RepID=UPI0003B6671F|nr:hypothetical protein [Humibacter albus]
MTTIDGLAAANRAQQTTTNTPGYCLATVNGYFGNLSSIGAHAGQYPDAIDVYNNDGGKLGTLAEPPRGSVVLWGATSGPRWAGDENWTAGDICISLGGGYVRASDWPSSGRVGTCTIQQRTNQVGRPYLGAQTGFLGYTIDLGATAAATTESEDDMPIIVTIDDWANQTYLVVPGRYIEYITEPDPHLKAADLLAAKSVHTTSAYAQAILDECAMGNYTAAQLKALPSTPSKILPCTTLGGYQSTTLTDAQVDAIAKKLAAATSSTDLTGAIKTALAGLTLKSV